MPSRRLAARHALVAAALLLPVGARAQQPAAIATLRIEAEGGRAASGVLSLAAQGRNALLTVVATDATGKPIALTRFAPTWTTSDESVAELNAGPGTTGKQVRVLAQHDGRATITVTMLGRSATLPVFVGEARKAIAAAELAPAFRVARLEVRETNVAAGNERLQGRALLFASDGHGARLQVRAFAADGRPLSPEEFPVTWATSDARVVELSRTWDAEAHVVGRGSGHATVTASVQGVTLRLEGYVGDARGEVDAALLVEAPVGTSAPILVAKRTPATLGEALPVSDTATVRTSASGTSPTVLGGTALPLPIGTIDRPFDVTRTIAVAGFTGTGTYVPFTVSRSITTQGFAGTGTYVPFTVTRTITLPGFQAVGTYAP